MAKVRFKVVAPGAAVHINVIQGKFDTIWEIRHPMTVCDVEIPKGEMRTVFINAIGPRGTNVVVLQGEKEIFNKDISAKGALGRQIIIKA